MMLKLRKCTLCSIVDPNSHHACSSPTTMRSGHLTEFCSIPTSSTFQSKTSWTSSRPPWTACWASASRTSQTAWSPSCKSSESSTESPWKSPKTPGLKDWNATIKVPTQMTVLWRESSSTECILWGRVIRIWKGGSGKCPACPSCISLRISIPLRGWLKPMGLRSDYGVIFLTILFDYFL